MKKFFAMMLMCLALLQTRCIYQNEYSPKLSDEAVWVCENPRMEFYCSETRDFNDVVYINGERQFVCCSSSNPTGRYIKVEEDVSSNTDGKHNRRKLFRGEADYKKNHFDIKVTDDYANLFGGELPTLHFEKRDIDEYFAEVEKAG